MTHRFMVSVAALTLMAGTGLANAQGTGMSRDAPSAAPTQQNVSSSEHGSSEGAKSKTLSSETSSSGKDVNTENRSENDDLNKANRIDRKMSNESEGKSNREGRADSNSQTVGQAGLAPSTAASSSPTSRP